MLTFYEKEVEKLFINIMKVIVGLSMLGLAAPLLNPQENYLNILSNLTFISFAVFSGFLFKLGRKQFAFHFFAFSTSLLFLVDVLVFDLKFMSLFMIFPCVTLYTFIFFRKIRTQIAYLVLGLICQYIAVYFVNDGLKNGITDLIGEEWIYYTVYNVGIFGFCYFFISNLKRFRTNLLQSRVEMEKNKADLALKAKELEDRNQQIQKFIEASKKQYEFESLVIEKLSPLSNNVENFLEMLRYQVDKKMDEKEIELLDFVSSNSHLLNKCISGLYEFSFALKKNLNLETCQVSKLIQEIKIEKFDEIVAQNAYLGYNGGDLELVVDQPLFKQLLNLLIENSIHFSSPNIQTQILIHASENAHSFDFKIMDNGPGIPKQFREEVFKIFAQVDSKNPNAGVGVGLSICSKIVERHKGTIWIEESKLGGTCIAFQIPKLKIKEEKNTAPIATVELVA